MLTAKANNDDTLFNNKHMLCYEIQVAIKHKIVFIAT
jgi:hypothetical protein